MKKLPSRKSIVFTPLKSFTYSNINDIKKRLSTLADNSITNVMNRKPLVDVSSLKLQEEQPFAAYKEDIVRHRQFTDSSQKKPISHKIEVYIKSSLKKG